METAELLLEEFVRGLALVLEFTAALCIAVGFVKTFILLLKKKEGGLFSDVQPVAPVVWGMAGPCAGVSACL